MQAQKIHKEFIRFRKLQFRDLFAMKKWGIHESVLLFDYQYPEMSYFELFLWIFDKKINPQKKYFAVLFKGQVIGFVGLKKFDDELRTSELGYAIGANWTGQGMGKTVLASFLEIYFEKMAMKEMTLDVQAFNKRAKKIYDQLGFYHVDQYYGKLDIPGVDQNRPEVDLSTKEFIVDDGEVYALIYSMTCRKDDWERRKHANSNRATQN